MPTVKKNQVEMVPVVMDGVKNVAKANTIGPQQGWKDYTMRLFRMGPKGFTPHHQHDWEHINYVVRGRGRLTIGDQTHDLREGDYALVPSNTMHQFQNPFDEDFEFLCIVPDRGAY